ncbi:MAG: ZIP family metal transporter [Candidatus Berkelbacteria bacterium]|nr:ZIP family metal transporter [Candidatus Berkelbacteria bacterium]
MLQIFIYGLIAGFSLFFGALVGVAFKLKQKTVARFMAFGSGVLICALTFGLMEQAFGHGGFDAVILGFLGGGAAFIIGDYFIHRLGGRKHKSKHLIHNENETTGQAITLGAILDGVPETIALGIAVFSGHGTGLLILTAIILSNLPEGMSSITGLRREGLSKGKIYWMWIIVAGVLTIIAVLSFAFLHDINLNTIGILEAFAAGAILAMLADTMMPEAYEEGGFSIGILTVIGFLVAFILSRFK